MKNIAGSAAKKKVDKGKTRRDGGKSSVKSKAIFHGKVHVQPTTEISSTCTDVSMVTDAEASSFSAEQLQLLQKKFDEGA